MEHIEARLIARVTIEYFSHLFKKIQHQLRVINLFTSTPIPTLAVNRCRIITSRLSLHVSDLGAGLCIIFYYFISN